jgi:hypothetical protein
MSKSKSLFLGRFKGLWGHGSMRETLEMVTASRMQNMVDIRKKNQLLRDQNYFLNFLE